jgi:hypothetical protein
MLESSLLSKRGVLNQETLEACGDTDPYPDEGKTAITGVI